MDVPEEVVVLLAQLQAQLSGLYPKAGAWLGACLSGQDWGLTHVCAGRAAIAVHKVWPVLCLLPQRTASGQHIALEWCGIRTDLVSRLGLACWCHPQSPCPLGMLAYPP